MNPIQVSVIAAFYNNIRFLDLILAGFTRQTNLNFELIIADDGSGENVRRKIDVLREKYPFPVRHVWHEKSGWQKNRIMNKAAMEAMSEYLIFIDADCIPHRQFIKEHIRNREKNFIMSGRRLNLSADITQMLTPKMVSGGYLEKNIFKWLYLGLTKEMTHAEKGLYLPWIKFYLTRKNKALLGCNFSMYKEDFLKLNGFDERYLAPTVGEDTEIEWRAGKAGMKIRSVRNLAVQYHLYHKFLSRENGNLAIFEDTKSKGYFRTPYGIVKERE